MKPEEKYFVIKGIREDYQWGLNREFGYWLCSKDYRGISHDRFYSDKAESERNCEMYREKYRKAIANVEEGNEAWFLLDGQIAVGKVLSIDYFGFDMMCYKIAGCDKNISSDGVFKSKEHLLNYLENNIQHLKEC